MKKRFSEKTGSFSIKFVIIAFIAVIIATGMVSVTQKVFLFNEIQGIMDTAGIAALRTGVDDNQFRTETLKINESLVLNNFYKLVNSKVSTGSTITSFRIKADVITADSTYLRNLGISAHAKDQYFLVSESRVQYRGNPMIDQIAYTSLEFFNFFTSSDDVVSFSGAKEDGYVEIVIRSVARLALR